MKYFILMMNLLAFAVLLFAKHPIDDYEIMAEVSPPYSFLNSDGKPDGFSTEVLLMILKDMGSEMKGSDINFSYPWARSFHIARTEQKKMLFTMAITPVRSRFFRFAGPIITTRIALFGLKDAGITITSLSDFKKYKIGVISDDIAETILVNTPDGKKLWLYDAASLTTLVSQVEKKRLDLLAYEHVSIEWILASEGKSNLFVPVYNLQNISVSYAFSADTSDKIINDFNAAWKRVQKTIEYENLVKKYKFSGLNIK